VPSQANAQAVPAWLCTLAGSGLFPASMALGLVGLVSAIYAAVRRDRSWRMWVGLATGGLVATFWLLFVVGESVFPH
jgi:hypothetical protein